MEWFKQGYIPVVGANFIQNLANKDVDTASVNMKELRSFFQVTAINDGQIGEGGQSVPIMYMGSLQDQFRVQEIQDKIADYVEKKGEKSGAALKQWHEEYDKLVNLLKRESSKMTA